MNAAVSQDSYVHADLARDGWCTPEWLTALLPHVDLDPCSNARSTVRAHRALAIERGEDGLAAPWSGLVFVNPPYSDVLPWVERAEQSPGAHCGFLVNVDPSTAWWRRLQEVCPLALFFHKRIQFVPPQGVKPSTNSKPQALLMSEWFWMQCDARLSEWGTVWRRS